MQTTIDSRYGTLDRVLDHVKCDEILETLRHMYTKILPEPGYADHEFRRIVPEVAVWLLLEGLIEVSDHAQDRNLRWYRRLQATDSGKEVVRKMIGKIVSLQLDINVTFAHYPATETRYFHMKGYTPESMGVVGYDRFSDLLLVQDSNVDLWYARIEDVRFAKQTTLSIKELMKAGM